MPSRRSTGSRAALADEELEEVDDEDENDEFEAESLMSMPLDETDLESELPSSPRGSSPAKRSPGIARSPPASASAVQRDHMSLAANVTPRAEAGVLQREVEELRAKVRILEKKKEEDREKMREMDRAKVEAEQFLSIKPKLQGECQACDSYRENQV